MNGVGTQDSGTAAAQLPAIHPQPFDFADADAGY